MILRLLWKTYINSQATKNTNKLKLIAAFLGVHLVIFKTFHGYQAVSGLRTVQAVWNSYLAIFKHFREASQEIRQMASKRSKYIGLYERLELIEVLQAYTVSGVEKLIR